MNPKLILIFIGLSLLEISRLSAQEMPSIMEPNISKKEYKERVKVLKDTAREYYWNLEKFEELLRSRGQIQQKNQQNDSLAKAQKELLAELERLKKSEKNARELEAETQNLKTELAEVNRLLAENQKNSSGTYSQNTENTENTNIPTTGLYFSIQIGAYRRDNLQVLSQKAQGQTIITEESDGLHKYLIGLFENYQEAKSKMDQLLGLGLPEAWIVAYKDGQRIPVQQAMNYTMTASNLGSE